MSINPGELGIFAPVNMVAFFFFFALLLTHSFQCCGIWHFPIGPIRGNPGVTGCSAAGAPERAASEIRAGPTDKNQSNYIGKGGREKRGMMTGWFFRHRSVKQEI